MTGSKKLPPYHMLKAVYNTKVQTYVRPYAMLIPPT